MESMKKEHISWESQSHMKTEKYSSTSIMLYSLKCTIFKRKRSLMSRSLIPTEAVMVNTMSADIITEKVSTTVMKRGNEGCRCPYGA